MKYASLRNRIAALEALLPTEPLRIKVIGGMPPLLPSPRNRIQAAASSPSSTASSPGSLAEPLASPPMQRALRPLPARPALDPQNAPAGSVGAPAPKFDQGLAPVPRRAPYRSRRRDLP